MSLVLQTNTDWIALFCEYFNFVNVFIVCSSFINIQCVVTRVTLYTSRSTFIQLKNTTLPWKDYTKHFFNSVTEAIGHYTRDIEPLLDLICGVLWDKLASNCKCVTQEGWILFSFSYIILHVPVFSVAHFRPDSEFTLTLIMGMLLSMVFVLSYCSHSGEFSWLLD